MVPDASRCLHWQMLPGASRCFQMPPDAAQMLPDASRCLQMPPDASRCLQMPPVCFQMLFKCFQMPPRLYVWYYNESERVNTSATPCNTPTTTHNTPGAPFSIPSIPSSTPVRDIMAQITLSNILQLGGSHGSPFDIMLQTLGALPPIGQRIIMGPESSDKNWRQNCREMKCWRSVCREWRNCHDQSESTGSSCIRLCEFCIEMRAKVKKEREAAGEAKSFGR